MITHFAIFCISFLILLKTACAIFGLLFSVAGNKNGLGNILDVPNSKKDEYGALLSTFTKSLFSFLTLIFLTKFPVSLAGDCPGADALCVLLGLYFS